MTSETRAKIGAANRGRPKPTASIAALRSAAQQQHAPQRVVVAGDWHGNADVALRVIEKLPELLAGDTRRIVVHCGDFGVWPGAAGLVYRERLSTALRAVAGQIWFVDGNHEDFDQLRDCTRDPQGRGLFGRPLRGEGYRLRHLPRGHRWTWHDRTWAACGGGVSLDAHGLVSRRIRGRIERVPYRTEGEDWWPEEEITGEQEAAIIAGGHADVLVSHDCPSGVVHTYPPRPPWWSPLDLGRSDRHQERLQRIVDAVQPGHIMHGHLHMSYQRTCDFGYGPVEVTGLDCDGGDGANWAVLNVATMTWEASG